MAKFVKKPIEIEAEQYHAAKIGQPTDKWIRSFPKGVCFKDCNGSKYPHLHTIHQGQIVNLTDRDWVIPEPDGEHFYPCKPDIFEATYRPADNNSKPLVRRKDAAQVCLDLVTFAPEHEKYAPDDPDKPCGWCDGLEKAAAAIEAMPEWKGGE